VYTVTVLLQVGATRCLEQLHYCHRLPTSHDPGPTVLVHYTPPCQRPSSSYHYNLNRALPKPPPLRTSAAAAAASGRATAGSCRTLSRHCNRVSQDGAPRFAQIVTETDQGTSEFKHSRIIHAYKWVFVLTDREQLSSCLYRFEERDVSNLCLIDSGLHGDNRQIDISDKDSGILDRDIVGPLLLYKYSLVPVSPGPVPSASRRLQCDWGTGIVKSLLALRRLLE
jgi:hypothetical protein